MFHPHGPRRLLRSTSLTLAACVALAGPAVASHEPPRLGLTPIGERGQYFSLTMRPGATRQLQVEVRNFGHDEVMARTYAADAYSIINGGFGAEPFGDAASGPTEWLDYPAEELTLGPDEGIAIDFRVSVPAGTQPGEYIAAVVAENAEPYRGSDPGGVDMEQVNRTALAVAITVPGPRRAALEIGAVGHKAAAGISFVSFEVANTGNVHLKPAGEFSLRRPDGAQIAAAERAMDSVYGGMATLLEAPLATELAPGEYCAELSLTDAKTGASDATDCLPFTVAGAVVPGVGPSAGTPATPVLEPVMNDNLLPALLAVLGGVAALAAAAHLVRRRR